MASFKELSSVVIKGDEYIPSSILAATFKDRKKYPSVPKDKDPEQEENRDKSKPNTLKSYVGLHQFRREYGVDYICGPVYRETKFCGRLFTRQSNDVVEVKSWERVCLMEVDTVRQVIFSNKIRKFCSLDAGAVRNPGPNDPLICRWRMSDDSTTKDVKITRLCWADITAAQSQINNFNYVARDQDLRETPAPKSSNGYTMGDAFCGCGGVSEGARQAGLQVAWGLDKDRHAMDSYRADFTTSKTYEMDVSEFIQRTEADYVDILHVSPPCQAFSPANTMGGQHDEVNQNTGLAFGHLLRKLKPRMATVEQTYGILDDDHRAWFEALVRDCIELGYSVRWKVLYLQDYGVPQTRKRVFMILAGPGEILPDFPSPTHRRFPNNFNHPLPAFTINDAIDSLTFDTDAPDHDPKFLGQGISNLQLDGLSGTIVGKGAERRHPNGTRKFTVRELACLQTFPVDPYFKFRGNATERKKQIGNVVPPRFAKLLFEEVVGSLVLRDLQEEHKNVIVILD